MLREVRVLEEEQVVVGARRGDGVPDDRQRVVQVVGLDGDVEGAVLVGLADLDAVRQRVGQLRPGLVVAGRAAVLLQQSDLE